MQSTFMTIAEFCAEYRISRTTAYRLITAGLIPVMKVGRASRIRATDAQNWAASLALVA